MSTQESNGVPTKNTNLAAAADQTAGFARYREPTERATFLAMTQTLVPCAKPPVLIKPTTPGVATAGGAFSVGRGPRIPLRQHGSNLTGVARDGGCTIRSNCADSRA
jgi:hypothetical protein